MDIVVIVLQLILSLSILVITHEGGHFFFAKLFKIKVEKFYLFFDPWFSLFKFKKGETEYGIGWLPLGGYVKIAGMVDESMDMDQLKEPVQDWEFRAKPAYQRLLVMLGGVIVNILTAPIIFWFSLYAWGDTYIRNSDAAYGFDFNPVLTEVGFVGGDRLLGVNGVETEKLKEIANAVIYDDSCVVNIIRDGERIDIQLPHEFYRSILSGNGQALFSYRVPVVVDSVLAGSPAAEAGLARNDSIVQLDSLKSPSFNELQTYISSRASDTVMVCVSRASGSMDTLRVAVGDDGRIGFTNHAATRWIKMSVESYGLFDALPAGVAKGWDILVAYCRQLPMLFTKEGASKVGGFGTIAQMFPSYWSAETFWFNTAFLAIILAVMNILPIPALDGGHVLFLLVEITTGKKLSDKAMERVQTVGMILLFALMIYANGADVFRAFFK